MMIIKQILITCIILAVASCATSPQEQAAPLNKESVDKAKTAIDKYNNRVVSPIMYIANTACSQRHDIGEWPVINKPTSTNQVFELYEVISQNPDYEAIFKPKEANQYWRIKLSYLDKDDVISCRGEASIGKTIETEDLTLPVNMLITDVKSRLSLPYSQYEQENISSSMLISFMLFAKENADNPKAIEKQQNGIAPLLEVVILGSICALLEKNPHACPLQPSIQHTTDTDKNNELEEKIRNKLKGLF